MDKARGEKMKYDFETIKKIYETALNISKKDVEKIYKDYSDDMKIFFILETVNYHVKNMFELKLKVKK